MPRKPDAQLEARILNAAYSLWVKGGEGALTMRAVAKIASTTTPTLYGRFRNKQALLEALRKRAQQNMLGYVTTSDSITEMSRLALEFTEARPHEYELVAKEWAARLSQNGPTPVMDLLRTRLSEQLGDAPDGHRELALGLALMYHGASMLLLQEGIQPKTAEAIRQAYNSAFEALLEENRRRAESRRRAAD